MNASDWFKTSVEEVTLDVIVKARERELDVESETPLKSFNHMKKTLMDKMSKKMKNNKKVSS